MSLKLWCKGKLDSYKRCSLETHFSMVKLTLQELVLRLLRPIRKSWFQNDFKNVSYFSTSQTHLDPNNFFHWKVIDFSCESRISQVRIRAILPISKRVAAGFIFLYKCWCIWTLFGTRGNHPHDASRQTTWSELWCRI